MKKGTRYIVSIIVLVFCMFNLAKAQDDCTVKLNQAQKLYEEGKIEKIPGLISDCLESGFDKESKVNALRLLTLVYLFDDNTELAEKSLVEMLDINPEYKINPNVDPVEFIRLYKTFRTDPVFSVGAIIGNNSALVRLIQVHSSGDYKTADSKYSSDGVGFSIGLRGTYHLAANLHLTLEPMYSSYSFNFSKNVLDFNQVKGIQKASYLEIPLVVTYDWIQISRIVIYNEAGFAYGRYLSGTLDISRVYNNKENTDVTGSSLNTKDMVQPYNLIGCIGAGAKVKITRGNFRVGVRYKIGMNNLANTANRKNEMFPELTGKYRYKYDDYGLSSFSFMLSYNREFYIHKKKNKK